MAKESICKDARARMEKAVTHLQEEFKGLRTGRASTGTGGKYKSRMLWRFFSTKTAGGYFNP